MATFYLDYEGGNDANDGTTFANRWKTITSGATAARIAPGDTIRIMGSPDPTSLGISATWTNKSPTVTLASALNALITNCDTAWTASANVTCTVDTAYRTSTGAAKQAIAAGFTTGKVAYFALGAANDYSAYQGITFWAYVSATLAASTLSIRLCSDTIGATTVDTLAIPAISQINQWVPIYIDKGSALGASIQSIAIYADLDPGTINITVDNISTTKAAGNDCLNLQTLIGKNTGSELWWGIRALNGTTVTLDGSPNMTNSVTALGYYGTTESVTTYIRKTIKTDLVAATTTVVQAVQDSGSSGNLITFSGGWNRTDMTTQTLETWFDGQSGFGHGITLNAKTFIQLDKINTVRYHRGIVIDGADSTLGTLKSANCTQSGIYFNANSRMTLSDVRVNACFTSGIENLNGDSWTITTLKAFGCGMNTTNIAWTLAGATLVNANLIELSYCNWSCMATAAGIRWAFWKITTLITNDAINQAGLVMGDVDNIEIASHSAARCGNGANYSSLVGLLRIKTQTITDSTGYGVQLAALPVGADLLVYSLTTSGNASGSIHISTIGGRARFLKSSLAETTKIVADSASTTGGMISFHNFNGTAGDHRTYGIAGGSNDPHFQAFSESTVRHTASGLAWKLSVKTTTYITADFPVSYPVGKVYCASGVAKTISIWMRRTNTGITGILRVRGGQIAGVDNDVTASIGAVADTWEQQSIVFTPSESGVVEVDVQVYGGTTYSLYIDDMQAS